MLHVEPQKSPPPERGGFIEPLETPGVAGGSQCSRGPFPAGPTLISAGRLLMKKYLRAERRSLSLQMSLPPRWLTVVLLGGAVGGCSSAQPDRPLAVGSSAREQIGQIIGQAQCKKNADCRTLAIGLKACGGPEAYLAWSTASTDAQMLVAAAQRYAKQRRLQLDKPGAPTSDCAVVSDPGAHCVAAGPDAPPSVNVTPVAPGHCELESTGGAGGRALD